MNYTTSNFSKTLKTALFTIGASVLVASQSVSAQTLDSAKYQDTRQPIAVTTGDKIEVTELFWFGCGHCFALEPALKEWKKNSIPENAEFKKVPALFSKRWEFHGQAFYTMQSLKAPEAAYDDFFNAIHIKKNPMNTLGRLVSFLELHGFTKEQVESAFNSFDVNNKMRAAKKITLQSGATGVPAIIVDGKYLTSQQLGGGTSQMFEVVNQLVGKAAEER